MSSVWISTVDGLLPFLAVAGLGLPLVPSEPAGQRRNKEKRRAWLYDTLPLQSGALDHLQKGRH